MMRSPLVTVSQKYQKEAHRSLLMQHLRRMGEASRAELARITGLKPASVTTIMQEFIASGVVCEGEAGSSTPVGGRRPVALRICSGAGSIAGIDIDLFGFHGVVMGLDGSITQRTSGQFHTEMELGEMIADAIDRCRRDFSGEHLLAFGVSISGTVNPLTGVVLNSHIHRVTDYPLSGFLSGIPEPVLVENDANCGAWSEILQSKRSWKNGLFIFPRRTYDRDGKLINVELGGAVIVDGNVWYGSRFITGEFSLSSWFEQGYEAASFPRNLLLEIDKDSSARRRLLHEICTRILTTVRLLDPDRIIFAGMEQDLVESLLGRELADSWYTEEDHRGRIETTVLNEDSAAAGAASFVLARLYQIDHIGSAAPQFDISWDYVLSSRRKEQNIGEFT
jgi:predicted NBD/HSP70 family sugar kinase